MSEEPIGQFDAKDAFTYVDLYRNSIRKRAAILKEELEVKQKHLWEEKALPKHFYAELRALEDALQHVTKGGEPGWVVLGDPAEAVEQDCDPAELEACLQQHAQLNEERLALEKKLKQALAKHEEFQATLVSQRQEMTTLQRKLEQNNSTFMVVVATMFLVILVQLFLLWPK